MRSLEYRTSVDFYQALRCVQYRVPRLDSYGEPCMVAALSLRYGLVGIAAIKHLLVHASPDETVKICDSAHVWPRLVAEHFQSALVCRIRAADGAGLEHRISGFAHETVLTALPVMTRGGFEECLDAACTQFLRTHLKDIHTTWNPIVRVKGSRAFLDEAAKSVVFARCFFERRQCDLAEVPEIALLGE